MIVIALTATFERPLILFVIVAVALVVINIASCNWVQHHWDAWIGGNGERIEAKLEKMRNSRVMRHPVAWIAQGSDWWFALATAIINPILVVAAARIVGGKPISDRRIWIASIAYAIPNGVLLHDRGVRDRRGDPGRVGVAAALTVDLSRSATGRAARFVAAFTSGAGCVPVGSATAFGQPALGPRMSAVYARPCSSWVNHGRSVSSDPRRFPTGR